MPANAKPKVAVVTDNPFLASALHKVLVDKKLVENYAVHWFCSPGSKPLFQSTELTVEEIRVKTVEAEVWRSFQVVISAHCKQLFPAEMVHAVRCVNIHPGLNPHNRGWFPQVFSILNKMSCGATIHEIDEHLDHGAIVAQREVPTYGWDTSKDIYDRVQQAEVELIKENIEGLLSGNYTATPAPHEGNINLKSDFNRLCALDLNEKLTMAEAIDRLRALTHSPYNNAFFIDPRTGRKVFVGINLRPE